MEQFLEKKTQSKEKEQNDWKGKKKLECEKMKKEIARLTEELEK